MLKELIVQFLHLSHLLLLFVLCNLKIKSLPNYLVLLNDELCLILRKLGYFPFQVLNFLSKLSIEDLELARLLLELSVFIEATLELFLESRAAFQKSCVLLFALFSYFLEV